MLSLFRVLKLGILLLAGGLFGCQIDEQFKLGKEFSLVHQQIKSNVGANLKIKFEKVVSDDRCAIEAACAWVGSAAVEMTFSKGDQSSTFTLNTGLKESSSIAMFGYDIAVIDLKPEKSFNNPAQQKDYVLTVKVTKGNGNSCSPTECGPMLGMPNYICDDGITVAGPGPCIRQSTGTCGWQVISCPQ